MGHRALMLLLLWVPVLGVVAVQEDAQDQKFRGHAPAEDLLSRLGRATWDTLESWVGSQLLHLVAESLSTTVWVVSSGISVALTMLCGILSDLLAATGFSGDRLVRTAALSPSEVQRVLLWGLVALVGSWLLSWLRGLLLPALRWVKIFCFLGIFLNVATSQETPTAKAGMLLGLWVLERLVAPLSGGSRLDEAVRNLEWKVEELRRRQKWGGPRNREE